LGDIAVFCQGILDSADFKQIKSQIPWLLDYDMGFIFTDLGHTAR